MPAAPARVTTLTLDNIRQLPLLTGLATARTPLAPTVSWDRAGPSLLPSGCITPCLIGFRLDPCELERINTDGRCFSPLQDRSTVCLVDTPAGPEPNPAMP